MDGILASVTLAAVALVLLAGGVVLLVILGPTDFTMIRPRWEPPWPRGVQEEEPHAWDFSRGPRGDGPAVDRGPEGGDGDASAGDEPVGLARVRAAPPGPWRPRRA
jgi:hypothetical protein